jgi:UDP-hydrolysing UDP-N-acetyl-D-glucosamine 2-epimerase
MSAKICIPITNRTNYSKLKNVMIELRKLFGPDALRIVASSTILLEKYGEPFHDLERDGFTIDRRIDCILMNDSHEAMAKTLGLSVIEHATYLGSNRPDMMLIVGDRFDMLAAALAASMMNIPIAHIQGGETSGTIDNTVRDLISRQAQLHFVATERSRVNLMREGIDAERIYNFGCPAVEYIVEMNVGQYFDRHRLRKRFKRDIDLMPNREYFLVMAHPDTTVQNDVDMDAVLRAIESVDVPAIIFYPNADAKNARIVAQLARHKENPKFYMVRHMPLEDFVHAMAHCSLMIGNSSSGIREAASFGVPVLNIGTRQRGRERNPNVIDIASDYETVLASIKAARGKRCAKDNLYYQSGCAANIAKMIATHL